MAITLVLATSSVLALHAGVAGSTAGSLAPAAMIAAGVVPDEATLLAKSVVVACGFDASTLAAAGLTIPDVESLISRVAQAPEQCSGFLALKAAVDAAGGSLAAARQAAADGNSAIAEQIPALAASLESAVTALETARSTVRETAMSGMPSGQRSALDHVDAARQWKVPVEFKIVARTAEEWSEIEQAVRREARCIRVGQTIEPEHASLLASIRSESAVVAAASAVGQQRAAIEAVLASP